MTRPTIDNLWGSTGTLLDPGDTKANLGWIAEIPPFQYQNWWQNRVDLLLENIEKNGVMEWDTVTTYRIGSWALATDNDIYKSISASNQGNDPISSPANWSSLGTVIGIPSATETVEGIAELATQGETDAGTDDTRIVTPLKLTSRLGTFVRNATTTVRGFIEIATNTEAQTGTDTVRAVTPAGLASVTSTETRSGLAEIATQSEADVGTDDTRIVTPLKLASRLANFVRDSTVSVRGFIKLASQIAVDTGTNSTAAVTPDTLFGGGSSTIASTGGIKFPSWLFDGFTVNWGSALVTAASTGTASEESVVFAETFSTAFWGANVSPLQTGGAQSGNNLPYIRIPTTAGMNIGLDRDSTGATNTIYYLAWGK